LRRAARGAVCGWAGGLGYLEDRSREPFAELRCQLSAFILAFGLPICGEMRVAIKEILT
jgi:hypothetical protein